MQPLAVLWIMVPTIGCTQVTYPVVVIEAVDLTPFHAIVMPNPLAGASQCRNIVALRGGGVAVVVDAVERA